MENNINDKKETVYILLLFVVCEFCLGLIWFMNEIRTGLLEHQLGVFGVSLVALIVFGIGSILSYLLAFGHLPFVSNKANGEKNTFFLYSLLTYIPLTIIGLILTN